MSIWRTIDYQTVSRLINFNAGDPGWTYAADPDSMFGKQAEGTARLYNLLAEQRIAMLADEVGMGKTYQALGVAALVWKQNPAARILIIAPNHSVAANWCDEYDSFVKRNYRESDNIVRTAIEETPVYSPYFCSTLREIADVAKQMWCHLFIAKTSSFSYVLYTDEKEHSDKCEAARISAANIRHEIPFAFDLLILDEAHYFRNKNGGSLRVNSAEGFFGGIDNACPVADRVLLLTATPNHSGVNDIKNIVSYFDRPLSEKNSDTILQSIGVRRFRRLANKNKYQYREEVPEPASFGNDIEAELFFALYQKKLSETYKGQGGSRFMYGYLEGFESMTPPQTHATADEDANNKAIEPDNTDYHKSFDTEILQKLAAAFRKLNGKPPAHPKYNSFIDRLTAEIASGAIWQASADIADLKHLVFTRRIPSVTEITGRLNHIYDKQYLHKIEAAVSIKLADLLAIMDPGEFRRQFDIRLSEAIGNIDLGDADSPPEDHDVHEDEDSDPRRFDMSRVFDLFTVKKKEGGKDVSERTHASNFRSRFSRKDGPYALFFEPASDYKQNGYPEWKAASSEDKVDYRSKASEIRATDMGANEQYRPDTLWAVFYRQLEINANLDVGSRLVKDELDSMLPEWREAFARYLKKGILLASSGLIELYCWFIETLRTSEKAAYSSFIDIVAARLPYSHLFALLCEATKTFHKYAEKVCAATTIERLKEQSWRFLDNQNPAAAVTGATHSRERHIKAFNSPFFPNVLIATSVFQEGVNLQFFCRHVHHYGIAWTPGDNEQRVGRIDRLFSLTERRLSGANHGGSTFLQSHYPYLKGTLDETQLISFLHKKIAVEDITDRCGPVQSDKHINITCSIQDWPKLMRKPVEISNAQDPYPAGEDAFSSYVPCPNPYFRFHPVGLLNQINRSLTAICAEGDVIDSFTFYVPAQTEGKLAITRRRRIGMVDPLLKNGRRQPFYIELFFSSEFSGMSEGMVYCLRFITPFHDDNKYKALCQRLHQTWISRGFISQYPLVKLAVKSAGAFRNCMMIDLPFFFSRKENFFLDDTEIALGLKQLLLCADTIEKHTYEDKMDLHLETHGFRKFFSSTCDDPATELTKEHIHVQEEGWEQLQSCLLKEFTVDMKALKEHGKGILASLAANYELPVVCFYQNTNNWICRFSLPSVDLQVKEFDLLKKWFAFNKGRFGLNISEHLDSPMHYNLSKSFKL